MSISGRIAVFACLLSLNFQVVTFLRAEEPLPNIIVILADDMGLDSVSAFNSKMGMKTPAIDLLASQGMSFSDAHSSSAVCTPTRYGVLTGRYNWRSRLKRGIVGKWERPLIEEDRTTLPEMLKQHGYQTACIGKWHLGWNWPKQGGGFTEKENEIDFTANVKGGPNDHGFDYHFGDDVPNWPPYIWRENEKLLGTINSKMKAGFFAGVGAGPAVENWDFRAVLFEYEKRCADYIRQNASETQPYFLYVPLPSPHTPIAPHQSYQGKSGVSEYADFLIQTDATISAIMKAVEETGEAKNTVVFFTCDNGTSPKANFEQLEAAGIHLREHRRGWKADLFEGGHRVPFIVRWPGKIKKGTTSYQVICLTDIMATCAEIVEHQVSENMAEDSVSLMPVLQGKEIKQPLHDYVINHSISGHFAIRSGKWKLMFCRGSGGWSPPREAQAIKMSLPTIQLYNLDSDPKESNNVASENPEVVAKLTDELKKIVVSGRSTPGKPQPNHNQQTWWNGLPWKSE